ncbi:flagellar biosynthetic protein FliO [Pusillimonas noertemannii]|uniref:flagellar biosynthetic protein FliO n=1 Tax=Pusillimonas noertemannii TaxID=305977 RepID=UPI0002E1B7A1|nr:flagellar biosynthetic protein FliO [Pusillimonas noertemannii]
MNEGDVLRMVGSLALIVLLILAGAWLMRRAGWLRAGAGQAIRVVGAQSLGARSSVAIVQIEDQRLVLGVTPQQITLLHTLPAKEGAVRADDRASGAPLQPGFAQALRAALTRGRTGPDTAQP